MPIVHLSDNTDVSKLPLALFDTKGNNKYGTMYMLNDKIQFVTKQPITDYRVYTSDTGKNFLCVKSPQINNAVKNLTERLAKENGFEFRAEKETLYIRTTPDMVLAIPKLKKLNVSIHVYGVFTQSSTKTSFLQMELSDFKAYPLVDFDAMPQ